MILEGLVTTVNPAGELHIAPMGPQIDPDFQRFALRPFPTSQTCKNLLDHREGVLHVTDDVFLLAEAAIGRLAETPPHRPAESVRGFILTGACRALEFRVLRHDAAQERVFMECEVVRAVTMRDFFGFNRAKHAIVEAAILATRVHLIPPEQIAAEFSRLEPLVRKTGGPAEFQAFELLTEYVNEPSKGEP